MSHNSRLNLCCNYHVIMKLWFLTCKCYAVSISNVILIIPIILYLSQNDGHSFAIKISVFIYPLVGRGKIPQRYIQNDVVINNRESG